MSAQMTCPPAERLVALVDGRLGAPEQTEVESHIDVCESCRIALASAVRKEEPQAWKLGRYRIDDMLGAGGMGIVYRAWDPSLSREVAIKVVKSEGDDLRARLAREAQSLARLNHLNVCQVYDVGIDGDELWIAMELVRGVTMRAWLATKPERASVLELLTGAGRGLAAAHAAGLVHRDVKPENVLVDRSGRAVVSDFGLARDTADRATRTSVLAGTPAYMAPEQLEGAAADARSDQYAFAVMAHEALTGARPRPRNQVNPSLPPRLRASLERALSDDPGARYPSIEQLIEAFVGDDRPRRARAVPMIAAASLALVGIAGAVILTRSPDGHPEPVAPVVALTVADAAPVVTPSLDAAIAEPVAIVQQVDAGLRRAPPLDARSVPTAVAVPHEPPPPPSGDLGTHITAIQRFVVSGDGKACLAEFKAFDWNAQSPEVSRSLGQLRSQCLMLAGQCEAGKQSSRAYWQSFNFNERQVDRSVDADVMLHCRGGVRSDRDQLLRASFVLEDFNFKHTVAECKEAYATAKQLLPTVASRGDHDLLHDAASRFNNSAAGCFARAGDCALAWTVAKELDTLYRRDSNDYLKRENFANAVAASVCVDKSQGQLTDAEIVWRAMKELDLIGRLGKRPPAFCDTRIELISAALRRLGDVSGDSQLQRVPRDLAARGTKCRVATAAPP